ncbi:pyridoxamine 5'-phosphate oxidase-domain-containing protein [Irpex rosettiformis]|uniref:Pyridoxamine 5'-phosphate oxidase-domain-containing protein n=1 Tax=Irpex rosettiformis TaxID=378272 RepID=A0ACB8UGY5_9APHY|nr:pyridoxamine 5'-phosphate oxidase-domain-containing protein [Irpex rosettiformis]
MKAVIVGWLIALLAIVANAEETVEDAARIARKLVDSSVDHIGTMATIFPEDHESLAGQPFSLQEYYASCHSNGSLTLLFMPISRHSQNILHSSTHSASISIWSEHPAASRARVALVGNVTVFANLEDTPERDLIQSCYLETHPDAKWWIPGPREPHIAYWARFDIHNIYFVGGFGGLHYIGYIPPSLYADAGSAEMSLAGRLQVQLDG